MQHPLNCIIVSLLAMGLSPLGFTEPVQANSVTSLAASCYACHGPDGNSMGGTASLAGLNASYFAERMQGFKDGSMPATVMHQHAKGLTQTEILALADYFATLPRKTPKPLPYQSFKGQP